MKLGIIGFGFVGKGMYSSFKEDVHAVYDPHLDMEIFKDSPNPIAIKKEDFRDLDVVIISVMTKSNEDGSCDTSILEYSVKWLTEMNPNCLVVVKSAVPPFEAQRIKDEYNCRLVISPEYLGESKYFIPYWKYPDTDDIKKHTFQVFGGDKKDTSQAVDLFIKHCGPEMQYLQTNLKTAALCKYMANSFFAMKVAFCNEWFDIAENYGVDYNELREVWAVDPRVGRQHTAVFKNNRGYGGKCFPKDTKAIIHESTEMGYEPKIMKAMNDYNDQLKK